MVHAKNKKTSSEGFKSIRRVRHGLRVCTHYAPPPTLGGGGFFSVRQVLGCATMIAFANGPHFGTHEEPLDRDALFAVKFQDKLKAVADVSKRLGTEVVHLSSSQKMHGGKEIIGETEAHFVLWLWKGPGRYEVSMEPRPGAASGPQAEHDPGEVPDRAYAEQPESGVAKALSNVMKTMRELADRMKKLLRRKE